MKKNILFLSLMLLIGASNVNAGWFDMFSTTEAQKTKEVTLEYLKKAAMVGILCQYAYTFLKQGSILNSMKKQLDGLNEKFENDQTTTETPVI